MPLDLAINVDWRVLLYTLILSVAAGVLFGLAPAWAVARPIIANGLRGEDVLARPGRMWSLRNILVVSQIAMSLVLLCATGLFLRSLENASKIDIGFRSRGVLMMAVDPRLQGYSPDRTTQLLSQLRRRSPLFLASPRLHTPIACRFPAVTEATHFTSRAARLPGAILMSISI